MTPASCKKNEKNLTQQDNMKKEDVDRFSSVCRFFLRPRRPCSISRFLLLAELWGGELSSLALERRLKGYGLVNPRVLLNDSGGLVHRLVREDGICWVLSERGEKVLTEAVRALYNDLEGESRKGNKGDA